ncbi:hypothetical protein E2C01_056237 [Portunus trituberculatus]|nr:hypothetical protein [Portunus trituberculatus]
MVRYAQVEHGAPFPDTPEDPPHITDLKQKRSSNAEETGLDPTLACLYRMSFGASQLYVYALAWIAVIICAPVYVDYNFLVRQVPTR